MNDEQLATDIRRAFGRYRAEPRPIESLAADSLGVGAAPGLDAGRPPLLARRRLLGGLSLAGVAAAVAMAFALTLGIAPGPTQPDAVYAGWQAIPTKNDETMRTAATSQCLDGFRPDARLLVQDQRGRVAMFVFGAFNEYLACVLIPDGKGGYRAEMVGVNDGVNAAFSNHFGWSVSSGPASDLPPEVTMFGTTDASKVVIRRADGSEVVASVAGGIFLAWWPGCAQPAAMVAYDGNVEIASRDMAPGDTSQTCRA